MFVLVPDHGAVGAAAAALIAAVVTGPFELFLLTKAINVGPRDLLAVLWRPCIGTLVMSVSILAIRAHVALPGSTIEQIVYLFCVASTAATIYGLTIFLLWRSTSDSKSAEAWMMELAARFFARLGLRSRFI
jgi:hypothetical protein